MDNNALQPNNMHLPEPVEVQPNQSQLAAPAPAMPLAPVPQQQVSAVTGAMPAADIDEIEPHWIQAVETMIRQHIDDPRALSQKFSELKTEYVRNRYGIELKGPGGKEKQ